MTGSVIAVAGATGAVGRPLVKTLRERGHHVVPLSRSDGIDLLSRGQLNDALDGVDTVIDVSNVVTTRRREALSFFRRSTENLLAAGSRAGVGHHVLLSIVGIDDIDYGYYAGKRLQEELVATADVPHAIVRATQFHEFAGQMLKRMRFGPAVVVPKLLCCPVSAGEVAVRLTQVAESGPQATADTAGPTEMAGPEPRWLFDMVRALQRRIGDRHVAVSVPLPGTAGRAMRDGGLLPRRDPSARGVLTYDEWLDEVYAVPAARGPAAEADVDRRPHPRPRRED